MRRHGELIAVGVEGCGSWGAGLARHLTAAGVRVVEVNRPNRQNRRRRGKSDVIDAEAAARAVLAGDARVTPNTQSGPVEAAEFHEDETGDVDDVARRTTCSGVASSDVAAARVAVAQFAERVGIGWWLVSRASAAT